MQPEDFDDFLGQQHLLDHNKPLRRLIEEDKIVSVIFYGPPGTGKTALAISSRAGQKRGSSQSMR